MTQEPPQPPEQPDSRSDSQADNSLPRTEQSGIGDVAPDVAAVSQANQSVNQSVNQLDSQGTVAAPPEPPPSRTADYGPPSLQEVADEFKIVVRDLTITILRAMVRLLEAIIARLEAPPPLSKPTLALPGTAEPGAPTLPPVAQENWLNRVRHAAQQLSETARPVAQQILERARPLLAKAQPYWNRGWDWWTVNAIPKIRAALPLALNDKLTDRNLTGAIATLVTVLLITINTLSPAQPPPKISQVPSSQPPVVGEPTSRPTPAIGSAPPAPSPPASPSQPVPMPSTPGAIASPPPLSRPPDQPLVAAIQDQVTAITDQYSERLIQSVQANFRSSRLIVTLGDGWYTLSSGTQDKLSTEILKRANKLNFIKLELTDADGVLVARSPVIGSNMIILKRGMDGVTPESANG